MCALRVLRAPVGAAAVSRPLRSGPADSGRRAGPFERGTSRRAPLCDPSLNRVCPQVTLKIVNCHAAALEEFIAKRMTMATE
jgi:hypothetical protein